MNDTLDPIISEARDVKQASSQFQSGDALSMLIQQNGILMSQMAQLHQKIFNQLEQPLKAALERKRLRVIGQCPAIGKDMLVKFQTGGAYSTTDTNVVKNVLNPLLEANGISYQCVPLNHVLRPPTPQSSYYLHEVVLQFTVTDVETGYTEVIPGEWRGIWLGALDKGYASAITNGIGKFLIGYFNIASFDRPEEHATDEYGNAVTIREQRKPGAGKKTLPQQQAPSQDLTKAELDYGQAKAVFSAIKTPDAVKTKYEEFLKIKDKPLDKLAVKKAFIERYYQLVDLDLSDENQNKFIVENWKGTLYAPNGKHQNYRIFVYDAEIAIRNEEVAKDLAKLEQYKVTK